MKEFYLFVGIYIIVFSMYMIYFYFRNKKKKQRIKMIEEIYLEKKYRLDLSRTNYALLCRNIALVNSFVIVSTMFLINIFDNFVIKVLVAFVTVFALILILYGILGIYYRRNIDE